MSAGGEAWFARYEVRLDPPRRCTRCSLNLTRFVNEDPDNARLLVLSQPERARVLAQFLEFCRNKDMDTKVLDREILRVLRY
ncbi:putative thioredoxin-like protein [Parapoxvirus red deer/HL953]|uniref:Putative thioredoxin-like protein n=1 Tax=Parapoxvirus red deer/HL953 TaxID=1579460 RepID=A0A0A7M9Z9_9POXV|nr:putative thioredoxin-like protein [Parapoxvirus red deer/HL953]AIZ77329.1 putative thioredoxin-like protein [Parapoxvirus red deer/HL953]